jgi:hypothetical protein
LWRAAVPVEETVPVAAAAVELVELCIPPAFR